MMLASGGEDGHGAVHHADHTWALIPQLLALAAVALGILAGHRVYFTDDGRKMKEGWKKQFPKLYDVVYNKYYCDEYIQVYLVERLLVFNMLLRAFDMYIVDGFVNHLL